MHPHPPTRPAARPWIAAGLLALACALGATGRAGAQAIELKTGEVVPRDVREMYDRGLQFLANSQTEQGGWAGGGEQGAGVTGMAIMALLASGEDPNFGLYSNHIRKALRSLISAQDGSTGFFGGSMYHHGFAMLALAEAYGAVDERDLWPDGKGPRSIGQALELAVRSAITSQKRNPTGAWRYSPSGMDADTSVSGAVLVGLLAARNAGIEVPDEAIDKAVAYFKSMTSGAGEVAYTGGLGGFGESVARSSIATLAYAVARRKDLPEFKATLEYLRQRIDQPNHNYLEYTRYYEAQALFQGDLDAWGRWNKLTVRQLKESQLPDGSFKGQFGPTIATSLSLLSLALNYRFLPIYER
ncbi:prenyltransferase/squalene oxidase repeat-containing protein [Tundrisphaera sp. TA3]|uniref:prenyltransferase/squalene oxidase repeat-containing protein n=1 Tax=Tundrisphaera sp. TA3 TaxID=3435775 RepID=UPI003EB7528C